MKIKKKKIALIFIKNFIYIILFQDNVLSEFYEDFDQNFRDLYEKCKKIININMKNNENKILDDDIRRKRRKLNINFILRNNIKCKKN